MVITGLIRNQFGGNPTWVRIPHPPPNKTNPKICLFAVGSGLFLFCGANYGNATKNEPIVETCNK